MRIPRLLVFILLVWMFETVSLWAATSFRPPHGLWQSLTVGSADTLGVMVVLLVCGLLRKRWGMPPVGLILPAVYLLLAGGVLFSALVEPQPAVWLRVIVSIALLCPLSLAIGDWLPFELATSFDLLATVAIGIVFYAVLGALFERFVLRLPGERVTSPTR